MMKETTVIGNDDQFSNEPGSAKKEQSIPSAELGMIYPHGIHLVMVMLSVLLAMFLAALDQVSSSA